MANRRLLCASVIESDNFTDLPLSAQALYMHLMLQGDDDGGLGSANRITRSVNATPADLQTLIEAGYLIRFESGVIFITHWKVHNKIRKDRYRPTMFVKEYAQLTETEAGIYQLTTSCQPNDDQTPTNGSPKLSKDKISKEKGSKVKKCAQSGAPLAPFEISLPDPLEESNLSLPLKDKLREWLNYKKELREGYKPISLKSLITKTENKEAEYGAIEVIRVIDECMANRYKGIIWDKLGQRGSRSARQSGSMDTLDRFAMQESC